MEGNIHKFLKEKAKEKYTSEGFFVLEEFKIKNKKVDLAIFDYNTNKLIKIIECINSQSIKNAFEKLKDINLNVEKEIVRVKRPKNPKARKIIEKVLKRGFYFTEFNVNLGDISFNKYI